VRRGADRRHGEGGGEQTRQGLGRRPPLRAALDAGAIDFHVDDFAAVLARALEAGARCEQKFEIAGRPPIAFCSDPFGNGFCIVGG
jgi:predicted enzyme related to lactoylglutathione lyase